MPLKAGDEIPEVALYEMTESGPASVQTSELFSAKKIAVFALPGAFTPTCSKAHLPGFVTKSDELFRLGIDDILCISVNDAWVMSAWGQQQNADRIRMLADGSADFTDAIDMSVDLTAKGMGVRSHRYAMIVDDGTVSWIGIDAPGQFEQSSAESLEKALKGG
ncbi:MAG: peroxiredoxin [Reinekea sp.]